MADDAVHLEARKKVYDVRIVHLQSNENAFT